MKKDYNVFIVVKKDQTINDIAKGYGKNATTLLIVNETLPKYIKEGKILFLG